MTNKLTVEQFVQQVNDENLDYALPSEIITGEGIVCEDDEKVLCKGEGIYNFMGNDPEFDGVFSVENVNTSIEIMNAMS